MCKESDMKKLLLATVITFTPIILPAHGSPMTGEALAYACLGNVPDMKREKNTEENVKLCNAYINGWDDARFAFLQGTTTFCPPRITVREMSVVFFDYVATRREVRKLPAAEALMSAFKDKFPCQ
jgi:Rap1a immunity proteins